MSNPTKPNAAAEQAEKKTALDLVRESLTGEWFTRDVTVDLRGYPRWSVSIPEDVMDVLLVNRCKAAKVTIKVTIQAVKEVVSVK